MVQNPEEFNSDEGDIEERTTSEQIEETEEIKTPAEKRGDSIPDEEDMPGMHPHHHLHN
jgi:hypothetical protein